MKKIKIVCARLLAVSMLGVLLARPLLVVAEEPPASLIITQVQVTGGPGKTSEDFVEFFNPNEAPVNLNGYRLVKRSATGAIDSAIKSWSEDVFVPARSFYLWANSAFATISIAPDVTTSSTLADNNGVALRFGVNDTGTLIDSISWGTASNGFTNISSDNPGAGLALTRSAPENSASSFSVAASAPRNSSVSLAPTYSTPYASPYATPYATPADPEPYVTPYVTPYQTPYATPGCGDPVDPPYETPYATPYSTPYETPYATPYDTPYQTPYATPESAVSSKIVFTEVLPNPDGDDAGHEQLEIVNNDSVPINIAGWEVSDKTEHSSSAVTLSGVLQVGQVLGVDIPSGKFTLTNTGETLYLFDGSHHLVDQVAYQNAPSGKSWQLFANAWAWNAISIGSANTAPEQATEPTNPPSTKPKQPIDSLLQADITEILANPFGSDAGHELLEIKNVSQTSLNTKDWMVDTKKSGEISDNAALLSENVINPGEYMIVTLPEELSLPNGNGQVRLFDGEGALVDMVRFQKVQEGFSYAKLGSRFEQRIPSFGLDNATEPSLPIVKISEILPNPETGEQEFIELFNPTGEELELTNFIVRVNQKTKRLSGQSIESNEYTIITDGNAPAMPNSGGVVDLLDPFGRLIDSVTYGKVPKGISVSFDGSAFVMTSVVTAGSINEIELVALSESATGSKTTAKKSTAKKVVAAAATVAKTITPKVAQAETSDASADSVTNDPASPPKQLPLPFLVLLSLSGALFVLLFRQLMLKNRKKDAIITTE